MEKFFGREHHSTWEAKAAEIEAYNSFQAAKQIYSCE